MPLSILDLLSDQGSKLSKILSAHRLSKLKSTSSKTTKSELTERSDFVQEASQNSFLSILCQSLQRRLFCVVVGSVGSGGGGGKGQTISLERKKSLEVKESSGGVFDGCCRGAAI